MSQDRGHIEHDSFCQTPLNEHTGTEPCLRWVSEKVEAVVVAHYAQGPQGNQIADYHADYVARMGKGDCTRRLGSSDISDRRDNRDPAAVGAAHLASRNGHGSVS